MNPIVGWILVLVAVAAGWLNYGWQGVITVVTVSVFWLLLQFNRAVKVMKNAGHAPVGRVASAVMLNAKLKPGMVMMQIVSLTRSLGRQTGQSPETWAWTDDGGSAVHLVLDKGRLASWQLVRPAQAPDGEKEESGGAPASP